MIQPKYHVLVCTSCKLNGTQRGFCHSKGSVGIVQRLMELLDEYDLTGDVLISNTGCFSVCEKGPIMVVYPEATWYGNVTEGDVERIVEEHFANGSVVKDLVI